MITRQLTRHATGAGFPFVVVVAATGAPVGTIGLWCERLAAGRASAGYAIAPTARGNGDAADALEALIDFAWSIEGLETVDLFIEPDNAASLASARHAGFRATAGLVDHEVAGHRAAMRRFARTRGR